MDIEKIRYAVTAAKTGNFSDAAYELYTSQSSVSKYISSLEDELQVKLFNRNGRRIQVSEAGQALLPYLEQVLQSYDSLLHEAQVQRTPSECKFVIGSTPIRKGILILDMIQQFSNAFPHVKLDIQEDTSRHQIEKLQNGSLDVAIIVQTYIEQHPCGAFSAVQSSKFLVQPLLEDCFVAVVGHNHPLACRKLITLEDLKKEQFVFVNKRYVSFHAMIDQLSQMYNFTFNVSTQVETIATALELVSHNIGITILSSGVASDNTDTVMIPLEFNLSRVTELIAYRQKQRNIYQQWLFNYAKNLYTSTSKLPQSDIQSMLVPNHTI